MGAGIVIGAGAFAAGWIALHRANRADNAPTNQSGDGPVAGQPPYNPAHQDEPHYSTAGNAQSPVGAPAGGSSVPVSSDGLGMTWQGTASGGTGTDSTQTSSPQGGGPVLSHGSGIGTVQGTPDQDMNPVSVPPPTQFDMMASWWGSTSGVTPKQITRSYADQATFFNTVW